MYGIIAQGVSWSTPSGYNVINNVSLTLGTEKTGLIGLNGSGKTTLVRLLTGEINPASGRIERFASIGSLAQSFEIHATASVAEVLGIAERLAAIAEIERGSLSDSAFTAVQDDWDIAERARAAMGRFGLQDVPFERRMHQLSGGETTRILLAGLTLSEPQFIILDEPTNNLDLQSRHALYDFIDGWARGMLVVSHDRILLRRMDRIAEIHAGSVRLYGGNFDGYMARRAVEEVAASRDEVQARLALRKVLSTARDTMERQNRRTARGKKAGARSRQAKIILNAMRGNSEKTTSRLSGIIERKIERAEQNLDEARRRIRPENRVRINLSAGNVPRGKLVLRMEDVEFGYNQGTGGTVISGLSLSIMGRERVALAGPNGCGKTTLLKLIAGELEPRRGTIIRGVPHIAYLPQSTLLLDANGTLLSNFQCLSGQYNDNTARELLSGFLFYDTDPFKPVHALSGGERLRTALAGILCRPHPPDFLILDEPTNHLDMDTLEQVENALQQFEGTLLVVSHDEYFLQEIGIEREFTLQARG